MSVLVEAFVELMYAKLDLALAELDRTISKELRLKFADIVAELFAADFCVEDEPDPSDAIGHARWRDQYARTLRNRKRASEWLDVVVSAFSYVLIKIPKNTGGAFSYDVPTTDTMIAHLKAPFLTDRNPDFFKTLKPRLARELGRGEPLSNILDGTPLAGLFPIRDTFSIPRRAFTEHGAIFAPSGHGKTQLLQHMIAGFLDEPDPPAMFILDSQGSMLRKIEKLDAFAGRLKDRLVVLDPPEPALNFFQFDGSNMEVLELAGYLFAALDRQLTAKQGTAIPYLLKLLQKIPGATLDTLREIMDDKSKFEASPYYNAIMQLDARSQDFFRHQFYGPEMKATKQQVSNRLYTILGTEPFVRMFAATENRFNAYEAMQQKKIVLVNTPQRVLGETASSIFGRFIIAQVLAAAYRRDPDADNHLALLVIDEAFEYFDEKTERILSQARKYGVGLLFATQYLEQMPSGVKAAVNATTAIKMAGPVSYNDAMMLAREMYTTGDFLRSMRAVDRSHTEYACHVRNLTPHAIKLTIPYGTLERHPQADEASLAAFRARNRERYGPRARDATLPAGHRQEAPAPPPPTPKRADPPSPLPLSDIELVITTARRIETLIETNYGAVGRGLHDKLTSIETKLPPDLLHSGRYIATMRNKVLHIDDFSLPDRDWFLRCAQAFEDYLATSDKPMPRHEAIDDPSRAVDK